MTFKHTPEQARALWIEALESGEYRQGTGTLKDGDSYCCLGVAAKLYEQVEGEGTELAWDTSDILSGNFRQVKEWLALNTDGGDWGRTDSLAGRNDTGSSFQEIADIIRNPPQGLFRERTPAHGRAGDGEGRDPR